MRKTTKSAENSRQIQKRQETINTVVVASLAGLLAGFILSMLLGAFEVGSLKDVPAWVQGVAGTIATMVSIFAVYLVNQTLQETRRMVEITLEMAKDQKRIGNAQTSAWILLEDYGITNSVNSTADFASINVKYKNFGATPAIHVIIDLRFVFYEKNRSDLKYLKTENITYSTMTVLPPQKEIVVSVADFYAKIIDEYTIIMELMVNYSEYYGAKKVERLDQIGIVKGDKGIYLMLC